MAGACHYPLSTPTERTTPRVAPDVNSGLWVLPACQCPFMDCNNSNTVVWDVNSGVGCACLGTEKSLYLQVNLQ